MDMLSHCRAMAAFCRQRAKFYNENSAFWIAEAEKWDGRIADHATPRPIKKNGAAATKVFTQMQNGHRNEAL